MPDRMEYNIVYKQLIKEYGVVTAEHVDKLDMCYGRNKTIAPYIKLDLFKKEQKEIIHNCFFDDDFKEKLKNCFNKYFSYSGDFMVTIKLK